MSEKRSGTIDMLHGPLLPKIILFALPLALSGIAQRLFNAVDSAMMGQYGGSVELAAVGSNTQLISLLVNLLMGIAVGSTVVVAASIGKGDVERQKLAVHTSYMLGIIGGVAIAVVGLLFAEPALLLMATPENVLDDAALYLRVYCLGMPFLTLYNFGSAILRADGDTRRPLVALVAAGLLNIGLNYVFLQLGWGIAGVAAATDISHLVAAAVVTWLLVKEKGALAMRMRDMQLNGPVALEVLKIGLPTGLQSAVFSISNISIQSGINLFGSDAVAGSTAAVMFEQLNFAVMTGFIQAGITFTSQNYAAGNIARCKQTEKLCFVTALGAVLITVGVFLIAREPLIGLFTTEPAAMQYAVTRMAIILAPAFIMLSYEIPGGIMRGLGHALAPSVIVLIGTCVLRVAWVMFVFPLRPEFTTLMYVYPVSWVATGSATLITFAIIRRKAYALVEEES